MLQKEKAMEEKKYFFVVIIDAFLRQCLNLRNHYTTGIDLVYVNN